MKFKDLLFRNCTADVFKSERTFCPLRLLARSAKNALRPIDSVAAASTVWLAANPLIASYTTDSHKHALFYCGTVHTYPTDDYYTRRLIASHLACPKRWSQTLVPNAGPIRLATATPPFDPPPPFGVEPAYAAIRCRLLTTGVADCPECQPLDGHQCRPGLYQPRPRHGGGGQPVG